MASSLPDAGEPGRFRWALLGGVWLIYFAFGMTTASLAPLLRPVSDELGVGNTAMGAILGSWPLMYILAALPCGMLLDRVGVRAGLLLAVAVMVVSALMRGLADSPLGLLVAVALFGIGGPLISVGAPKLIAELFEGRDRGTAMGVYITGPYLGGILSLSLTMSLLMPWTGDDWRKVMFIHAGAIAAAGFVWLALILGPAVRGLAQAGKASGKFNLAAFVGVLASYEVRLILAMSVGVFALNHALNNWLPELLKARGLEPVQAGYWAAIPSAVGVVSALTIPRVATRRRQVPILAGLLASMLGATLLLQSSLGLWLTAGLVLQGLARGTMMTMLLLVLMESAEVPRDRLGLAGGLFFTTAETGGVIGPVLFGFLSDLGAGFTPALTALSAVCLVLFWLLALVAKHRGLTPP